MKIGTLAAAALSGVLAILGGLAAPTAAQAAVVDVTYDLTLNGMSSGTCPGGVCGTITEVGDTTTSIKVTIDLATGVSFHANHSGSSGTGDFLFFDVTDTGGTASYTGIGVDGVGYSYGTPVGGSFVPNPGNFPGPYNTESPCTNSTAGKICGTPYTFTVDANGGTLAFLSPAGGGLFAGDNITFVADLSISGSCGDLTCAAGTGFVGSGPGTTVTTPEPSTWAMLLIGFVGLGYAGLRRTKTARALAA